VTGCYGLLERACDLLLVERHAFVPPSKEPP
jgi:hypothetical protein